MRVTSSARFVPGPGLPHVPLDLPGQGPSRADGDAVAAVDAGRIGQDHVELGGNPCVEATSRHGYGEGVLVLDSAGVDTSIAEDASAVVAHVELVLDLGRLGHGGSEVGISG